MAHSRDELQAHVLLVAARTRSRLVSEVCCVAVQGSRSAAERRSGTVQPLLGQRSCSQWHLALQEQGLPPHADSQSEKEKMSQRGARIQVFSALHSSKLMGCRKTAPQKWGCPSQLLHARQQLQPPLEARPCSAPSYHPKCSPGLELASRFGLAILYELPTTFSSSG